MILDIPITEIQAALLRQRMPDINRAALEGIAAEAYRRGVFSLSDIRELFAMPSRWEAQQLLASLGAWPSYSAEDQEHELAALQS
jgi:predicted HTH domain antitoxin